MGQDLMDLEKFLKTVFTVPDNPDVLSLEEILLRVTLATVMGFFISFVGYFTYTGKSFDKSIIHSQILLTIIFSIMINVIGQNIAWALGIFGSLSFVQFRTTLKDAKDTATFFYSIIIGVTCGAGYYKLAITGFAVMTVVMFLLKYLSFPETKNAYIKFSCKNLDDRGKLKDFFTMQKIKHDIVSISLKNTNIVIHINLDLDSAYELAKKAKETMPEYILSFSLDKEEN